MLDKFLSNDYKGFRDNCSYEMSDRINYVINSIQKDITSSFLKEATLSEVLTKSTPIEQWITDFIESDDPKFKGKSKEERRKMAIGAFYGKQNEEKLDEADFVVKIKYPDGSIQDGMRVQGTSEVDVRSRMGAILGIESSGFEILDISLEESTATPMSMKNAFKNRRTFNMVKNNAQKRNRKLRYTRESIREYLRRKRKKNQK